MKPYYSDDLVTIYHGDALDVLPMIPPASVDLVLTDPPYGIGLATEYASKGRGRATGRHGWKALDHPRVVGDSEPFDPTALLVYGRCVLWGANNYASRLPNSSSWLVWNRMTSSDAADAELAWTNLGGTVRTFSHMWDGYRRDSEIGVHVHPTQKPVALMAWIIARWTQAGDLILDPYMGSGPVAEAAKAHGRRYIGIEIEERYCEIAAQRCSQEVLGLSA